MTTEAATTWDDDDEATQAVAGGEPPTPPAAKPDDGVEPGSVIDQIEQEALDLVEDDEIVLQIGAHRRLFAVYVPLSNEELDDLLAEAEGDLKRRQRESGRGAGHRRKAKAERAEQGKLEKAVEREYHALMLATACEEILYEDDEGERLPLQELMGTQVPVTFNRTLAAWLKLDKLFGLDLDECTSAQVVTAMHSIGKKRSTAPLTAAANQYQMKASGISSEALREALGGI